MSGIASRFEQYDPEQDPGGDLADAVGLAAWYLMEHRARLAESVK